MRNSVLAFLSQTVKQHGNKAAIVDRERTISFQELDSAARRLATVLSGKVPDVRRPIAVLTPKGMDSIISFLAILFSGNFYAPLDENMPPARLTSILNNLRPSCLIADKIYQPLLMAAGFSPEGIVFVGDAFDETILIDETELLNRTNQIIDTDPVYTIYTSGSTGVPKGVIVPHRGVIDYIDWAMDCFQIDENVVIGNQSPFYFDNSTLDIYLCLAAGATLVIIPKTHFAFPLRLMEYVREMKINFIFWVPSVLITVANLKILEKTTPAMLQRIFFAGEVMPNKQLNYWRQFYPQAQFVNLYGPTEITVDCTYYIVNRPFQDHEPLPIGFPCRNTDILIITEDNRAAGMNETGELCVRGSSLAMGYWDDPEKTNKAFVQNPLQDKYPERIYRTGDLVYYNESGEIIFLGRKDNQIKHMGHRIELGEIETVVQSLAQVDHACVVYDRANEEIALFYQSSLAIDPAEVRKQLAAMLPKYMIPAKVKKMATLPLNANGKIDRTALLASCHLETGLEVKCCEA